MAQYHVSIAGQGYVLDLDRYARRIREPFAGKQSAGSLALADLRGPEQVLVISDWSGGEGAVQHDEARPDRYRSGAGLDGHSQAGALRIGPGVTAVPGAFDAPAVFQTFGTDLYLASVVGGPVFARWDGTTFTGLVVMAGPPSAMAVYLNRLYVGNAATGAVASYNAGVWTAAAFTLAAGTASAMATHYRQAAQYLYVAAAAGGVNGSCRIVFWDGAALSLGQFDLEEPGCSVMIPWQHHLWIFGADSQRRTGGIYTVDDSSSGGVWETHHLLVGNYFTAGCLFDGAIYLGCGLGGEVYRWDGTRLELAFRLATRDAAYSVAIRGMAVWDGALWISILDGAGASGLLRYDGEGLSRPVLGVTGTVPSALAVYVGDLHLVSGGPGSFVRVRGGAYRASGQLESGLISCDLPGVSKLFKSVTIVTSALVSPQAVQVEYRLEDTGGWTSLGTLSTVGATTATYAFAANTTGRQIAFRLTLTGTAGASSSPVLYELALRYVPRPASHPGVGAGGRAGRYG